jgi:hypothetical protein
VTGSDDGIERSPAGGASPGIPPGPSLNPPGLAPQLAARVAPAAHAARSPGTVGTRLATAAGVAGLAFAIIFTAAFGLLRAGEPPSDAAAFRAWWEVSRDRIAVGTYLVPFAGIAFIWFVAAVRRRIGHGEGLFFSSVFLGSALVFVATMFVTGAAAGSVIVAADHLDIGRIQDLAAVSHALAYAVFFGFTVKMAAMFMLIVASIGRTARALPRWLVLLTIALGLVLLVGNLFVEVVALVFPAWVAVESLVLIWLDSERAGAGGTARRERETDTVPSLP